MDPKKLMAFAKGSKKAAPVLPLPKGKKPKDEEEENPGDEYEDEAEEGAEGDEAESEKEGADDEALDEEMEEAESLDDDWELADEVGEEVQSGKVDGKLMKLMKDFDPEDNPPSWVVDEATWERAKEAVDPEGDGADKYDQPYAVVAHLYKKFGGSIK